MSRNLYSRRTLTFNRICDGLPIAMLDFNARAAIPVAVIAVYVIWTVFRIMTGNRDFLSQYGQLYTN